MAASPRSKVEKSEKATRKRMHTFEIALVAGYRRRDERLSGSMDGAQPRLLFLSPYGSEREKRDGPLAIAGD